MADRLGAGAWLAPRLPWSPPQWAQVAPAVTGAQRSSWWAPWGGPGPCSCSLSGGRQLGGWSSCRTGIRPIPLPEQFSGPNWREGNIHISYTYLVLLLNDLQNISQGDIKHCIIILYSAWRIEQGFLILLKHFNAAHISAKSPYKHKDKEDSLRVFLISRLRTVFLLAPWLKRWKRCWLYGYKSTTKIFKYK